jgi:GST-like protein
MIDFYYAATPNGWKVAIALEELGLEYNTVLMELAKGDQLQPDFMAISPNAKMPAIVDHDVDGDPITVFESGAILFYLAEKTGQFMDPTPLGRKQTLEWLFWQTGNQGPMGGQLSHFVNYAPEGQTYARDRYRGEYERCLAVLERWLEGREYLVGDYSIADMQAFPWAFIARPLGVSLEPFIHVTQWRARIKERPAVRRAINLYKDRQNRGQHNAANNKTLYNQDASHVLNKN